MVWVWLALAIALAVVEISTTQLVSVWIAIGAAVTAIFKGIFPNMAIGWQIFIFIVTSGVLLLATRPFVKKLLANRNKSHETNLELVLGKEAVVVEDINNILGKGAIKINGLVWSARSIDESEINVDEIVIFKEINGNKAMVVRKENEQ